MGKRFIGAVLAALMALSAASTALADDDLDDQLEDLRQRAAAQQEVTNEAAARVDSISEQMRLIQLEVEEASDAYKAVKSELDDIQAKIEENEELLNTTEKTMKGKVKKLAHRIRDIYINGQISYVDVLFGAKDFSDLMTRMDILKRIIKHDYDLVMEVKAQRELIIKTKAELETQKTAIEPLVKEADAKLEVLEDKKAEQNELLEKAMYDQQTSEQAYEELMAASEQVARMIRQRDRGSSGGYYSGEGMIWPLDGPVTSEFGWRVHPIFGTSRYHSGLDIGGDYGLPIRAAAGGTVIYSGWISGYGYAVIIDHGGGLTTLYGHNEELTVGEGESVSQGDIIAWCGSTGNSTGPHCHFEVRLDGEVVNPYDYL